MQRLRQSPTTTRRTIDDFAEDIDEFLAQLPIEVAAPGRLYWNYGLSQAEIGRLVGISQQAVSKRLASLRQRIERLRRNRHILALLVRGESTERIGRRFGLSARQVRRLADATRTELVRSLAGTDRKSLAAFLNGEKTNAEALSTDRRDRKNRARSRAVTQETSPRCPVGPTAA